METKTLKKKIRVKHQITATTALGLEEILAQEIQQIGGINIKIRPRAVDFDGDRRLLYKSNICLRTALRILKPIYSFNFKSREDFYYQMRAYNWPAVFSSRHSFCVDTAVFSQIFTDALSCSLKARDAIIDRFRHDRNVFPEYEREEPVFRFFLYVKNGSCTISLDSSGSLLSNRGYRRTSGREPLNEVLAAAMVYMSGWDQKEPIVDGMCGSGSITIEAAMILRNLAPGLIRSSYAFQEWKDFNKELYLELVEEARQNMQAAQTGLIFAHDVDEGALRIATDNMRVAGVLDLIDLSKRDFFVKQPVVDKGYLLLHPHSGENQSHYKIGRFYKSIGDCLSEFYAAFKISVLSSNPEALESIGLEHVLSQEIQNGPSHYIYRQLSLSDE